MTHYRQGWAIQNIGEVKIIAPANSIVTSWQHRNTDNDIKSLVNSDLGNGKLLKVSRKLYSFTCLVSPSNM
jgi:hypothetical protein